jgi:hypothetical protein
MSKTFNFIRYPTGGTADVRLGPGMLWSLRPEAGRRGQVFRALPIGAIRDDVRLSVG